MAKCVQFTRHHRKSKYNLLVHGLQDLKDTLIYIRISGYGQTGPKAHLAGYASVCEAYGGIRHLNGYLDRPPVRPNISLGDTLTGLHAAFGAVMALLHRQRHHLKIPGQVRHVAGSVLAPHVHHARQSVLYADALCSTRVRLWRPMPSICLPFRLCAWPSDCHTNHAIIAPLAVRE